MGLIKNVKMYPACITFAPIAFIPRYCVPECQLTPTDWANHDYSLVPNIILSLEY